MCPSAKAVYRRCFGGAQAAISNIAEPLSVSGSGQSSGARLVRGPCLQRAFQGRPVGKQRTEPPAIPFGNYPQILLCLGAGPNRSTSVYWDQLSVRVIV